MLYLSGWLAYLRRMKNIFGFAVMFLKPIERYFSQNENRQKFTCKLKFLNE
jgi:hypothetical protein